MKYVCTEVQISSEYNRTGMEMEQSNDGKWSDEKTKYR
jgi:hypothetical protein